MSLGYGLDDWVGAGNFSFHYRVQTDCGAHPTSCSVGTRGTFPGDKAVRLTTHLNLVPRSRMPGAAPPVPQYAFMSWCSVKTQEQRYLLLSSEHVLELWTASVVGKWLASTVRPAFDCQWGQYLLFVTTSTSALDPTQPPIQWVVGSLSQGVKRSECQAGDAPPFTKD